jgi:hypothetical protein
MKRFVEGTGRGQATLFPEYLEDWIYEDNPVRAIDAFVDKLGLAELGFAGAGSGGPGRPSYHPSVLLKLYPPGLFRGKVPPTMGIPASPSALGGRFFARPRPGADILHECSAGNKRRAKAVPRLCSAKSLSRTDRPHRPRRQSPARELHDRSSMLDLDPLQVLGPFVRIS